MSLEVTIKQKGLLKRSLPLEIILGNYLRCGNYFNDRLILNELGKGELLAFNPEHIGRGFSVIWKPEERKKVTLRLLQPTSEKEYHDFYDAVKRIAEYWNGSLTVDGNKQSLNEFLGGLQNTLELNKRVIKDFSNEILSGKTDSLVLHSAFAPLNVHKNEAELFSKNHAEFGKWLHSMQLYFIIN